MRCAGNSSENHYILLFKKVLGKFRPLYCLNSMQLYHSTLIWSIFGSDFHKRLKNMSLSNHVKPISYLKANAAKIAKELKDDGESYIITQNGEATMVVQSIEEYERKENAIAMLQIITQAENEISAGKTIDADQAFDQVRRKLGLNNEI